MSDPTEFDTEAVDREIAQHDCDACGAENAAAGGECCPACRSAHERLEEQSCQMCGAAGGYPCHCHDPQMPESSLELALRAIREAHDEISSGDWPGALMTLTAATRRLEAAIGATPVPTRYVNYGTLVARLSLIDDDEGGLSQYAHVMGSATGTKTIHSTPYPEAPTPGQRFGDPDVWTLMASYDLDTGERIQP